uniref:Putative secreted protein n=1 Tax=Anopheles aquasalis TaxID=42839 RepID=T1DP69_ANOAQ
MINIIPIPSMRVFPLSLHFLWVFLSLLLSSSLTSVYLYTLACVSSFNTRKDGTSHTRLTVNNSARYTPSLLPLSVPKGATNTFLSLYAARSIRGRYCLPPLRFLFTSFLIPHLYSSSHAGARVVKLLWMMFVGDRLCSAAF